MRFFQISLMAAIGLIGMVSAASAKTSATALQEAPAKDPMMEAMMKAGAPNENHKLLEPMVGHWMTTAHWWKSPESQPESSEGSSVMEWVMDGRFIRQTFTGTMMGQPFAGLGFSGYDNVKGEYVSIWMDNMMTGIMKSSGTYDAATHAIREEGTMSCPMTGDKAMWYRTQWKLGDADRLVYESYSKTPEGKEFRTLEVVYTRQK